MGNDWVIGVILMSIVEFLGVAFVAAAIGFAAGFIVGVSL